MARVIRLAVDLIIELEAGRILLIRRGNPPLGAARRLRRVRRDPRGHTVSTVFLARARGTAQAGDDAVGVRLFPLEELPSPLAFDHERVLEDFGAFKAGRHHVPMD